MKKKVLIISGSRAEFGLIEPIFREMIKSKKLQPQLLVTGMHTLDQYGKTVKEITERGFEITHTVSISPNGTMLSWLGEEIRGISNYCVNNPADAILILGDRDEAFAGAIVGNHLGIPVAHIHGGDLSGKCTADDSVRNAITQLSSFHFTATAKSAQRIIKMRGDKHVYIVGAPGIDMIKKSVWMTKNEIAKKYRLSVDKQWIVVLLHPAPIDKKTSLEKQIRTVVDAVNKIPSAEKIWIYPNSDTGSLIFIENIEKLSGKKNIHLYKNIVKVDFINFLRYAEVLIGNSSAGIIESAYFHLPVVDIGERQKGRERSSNVINTGYDTDEIIKAVNRACSNRFKRYCQKVKQIYGEGSAGNKITSILATNL